MRGIVLAGGLGSRLWPLTRSVSKHLLPVYDKPMIYYPLATLMTAGIREILLITRPEDAGSFLRLLGDGSQFGIQIAYKSQPCPNGIAEALLLAEDWLSTDDDVALILGDNLFHGSAVAQSIRSSTAIRGACIFAYEVSDARRYGVVEMSPDGRAISIEEKPLTPRSSLAVPGLYLYDGQAVQLAKSLGPSARGEIEITDVNRAYLDRGELHVIRLAPDVLWLDTGTFDDLQDAGAYVRAIESRQGGKFACLEQIAWEAGWIDQQDLGGLADAYGSSPYGDYIRGLARNV